ncbi:hypothetical protein BU15DRAFT_56398 [Melanogaster broomeanus]|nr:hypothetical protein BU15DRAFT_56398 [Melanogaster broomeanus]
MSGAAYLNKSLLSLVGEPFSSEHLVTILFHISQIAKVPLAAVEAIRATAFLLEDETTSKIASTVTSHISETAPKEIASQVITAISPHIANLFKATEMIQENLEEIKQMREVAEKTAETSPDHHGQPVYAQPSSYSAAVKTPINTKNNAPATTALARAATRDKQILIDSQPDEPFYLPEQTTDFIADKIKTAIEKIREENSPPLIVKAILKLKSGGLIIEFDSNRSAQWIRQEDNRENFLIHLGTTARIRDRTFPILIPFLPVSSPIQDPEWLRALEVENGLMEDVIAYVRWIKPIEKRAPAQRVAHAIFQLTTPQAANALIRDGMYASKGKLHPSKDKREPIRCARCQRWGHIARECKSPQDTCATCGHAHKTAVCVSYKTFHCISCNSHDHSSNDSHCPTYERKCEELDAKHPENSMPYYPTDETWTQVMLPPKPAPYRRPPPPVITTRNEGPKGPGAYRQSTLEYGFSSKNTQIQQTQRRRPSPTGNPSVASSSNRIPIANRRTPTSAPAPSAPTTNVVPTAPTTLAVATTTTTAAPAPTSLPLHLLTRPDLQRLPPPPHTLPQ